MPGHNTPSFGSQTNPLAKTPRTPAGASTRAWPVAGAPQRQPRLTVARPSTALTGPRGLPGPNW
eukprot:1585650-Lingulodinium_polyedra.AAC.1